jgi:hypothetical protein
VIEVGDSLMPKRASNSGQEGANNERKEQRQVQPFLSPMEGLNASEESPFPGPSLSSAEISQKELEDLMAEISSLAKENQETVDLLEKGRNCSKEVIGKFKEIMNWVDAPFKVRVGTVSRTNVASEAEISPQGVVSLLDAGGKVIGQRPLDQFQSQIVLNIIGEVLPEVDHHLEGMKRLQSERLTEVERIIAEIKKAAEERLE